jgi:hypothetical protein
MAAAYASGSFTTAAGGNTIVGIPGAPVAVIFWTRPANSETNDSTGVAGGYGFACSDGSQGGIASNLGTFTTASGKSVARNNPILDMGPVALNLVGTVSSWTSDGFVIGYTTYTSDVLVHYLAIYGSGVSAHAFVGDSAGQTVGTPQAFTGAGFAPTSLLSLFTLGLSGSATNGAELGVGFHDGTTQYASDAHFNSTSRGGWQKSGRFILRGTTAAVLDEASVASLDSDGLTLSWTSVSSAGLVVLALGGVNLKVGTFAARTSTGNQVVTGLGAQPLAALFMSTWQASTGTVASPARLTFSGARSTNAWDDAEASNPSGSRSITGHHTSAAEIFAAISGVTSGAPTLLAAATLTSLDTDGFTWSWSSTDGTAAEIVYAAFLPSGPTPVSGTIAETLSSLAAGLAGGETFESATAVALSSLAYDLVGRVPTEGPANVSLAPTASSAAGAEIFLGATVAGFSPLASAGTSGEVFDAATAVAFPPLTSGAAGLETFSGTASCTLGPLATTGAGFEEDSASASVSLASLASVGAGAETFSGPATATLPTLTSALAGAETFSAAGAASVSRLTSSGTGGDTHVGTVAAVVGPLAPALVGTLIYAGTATAALSRLAGAAVGLWRAQYDTDHFPDLIGFAYARHRVFATLKSDPKTAGDQARPGSGTNFLWEFSLGWRTLTLAQAQALYRALEWMGGCAVMFFHEWHTSAATVGVGLVGTPTGGVVQDLILPALMSGGTAAGGGLAVARNGIALAGALWAYGEAQHKNSRDGIVTLQPAGNTAGAVYTATWTAGRRRRSVQLADENYKIGRRPGHINMWAGQAVLVEV